MELPVIFDELSLVTAVKVLPSTSFADVCNQLTAIHPNSFQQPLLRHYRFVFTCESPAGQNLVVPVGRPSLWQTIVRCMYQSSDVVNCKMHLQVYRLNVQDVKPCKPHKPHKPLLPIDNVAYAVVCCYQGAQRPVGCTDLHPLTDEAVCLVKEKCPYGAIGDGRC